MSQAAVQQQDEADFLVCEQDGVITAKFNRPKTRNALTFAMYEGLANLCRDVKTDGSVKAIVVTGSDEKGRHTAEFTTPTGHEHHCMAPAPPGTPRTPMSEIEVWLNNRLAA